jgi:hypothetical protein
MFKLGFRNQKPPKKMEICAGLIGGMGKFGPEHRETVGVEVLEERYAEAAAAMQAVANLRSELRAALTRRTRALRELCQIAERSARRHANAVDFDPAQMLAGGIELVREKQPAGVPAAPERLRVEPGAFSGGAVLRWKRPLRRCAFVVEATTDPRAQEGWRRVKECTAAKCELRDLSPGRLHWFRVAALNAHGLGPWSGPGSLRPA